MRLDHEDGSTSFVLRTRVEDDRVRPTVVVEGEIDLETAPELAAALTAAMNLSTSIEIDFRGTTFIDSSGIETLITAYRQLGQIPEAIVLRDPSSAVRRVLSLSGTEHMFTVSVSEPAGGED
jgi:anti-anti-sigma factor